MKFISVTIQNFLSYGEKVTVPLANRGLVAVLGKNNDAAGADSNGAGKSAFLHAILWALYGETLREYKGDEVVNNNYNNNCVVTLELEDGDKSYTITRKRKCKGKRPNDLTVAINSIDSTRGTSAATQEFIDSIVGMDCKTFCQSVLMWHGSQSFSQMTDASQKQVLENILQIEQLAAAKDKAKSKLAVLTRWLENGEHTRDGWQYQLTQLLKQKNTLEVEQNQYFVLKEQRKASILEKIDVLKEEVAKVLAESDTRDIKERIDELTAIKTDLVNKQAELQQTKLTVTKTYNDKRLELATLEGKAQGKIDQITKNLSNLNTLVGKPCPTCQQVLDPNAADVTANANEAALSSLRNTVSKVLQESAKLSDKEEDELEAIRQSYAAVSKDLKTAQAELMNLSSELIRRNAQSGLVKQMNQQLAVFNSDIDALENEADPYVKLLTLNKVDIKDCKEKVALIEQEIAREKKEKEHVEYWVHGFGNQGLKSYVLDLAIPFLTERAQHYADIVSGGDLTISFNTQTTLKNGEVKEQFQVSAINKQGAEVYHGNSSGEQRRIDVAVGFALADLAAQRANKPILFRALDEPFVHLDETGVDLVVKLLHSVANQYETIFVITHDDKMINSFNHVVMIEKNNNESKVLTLK